MKWLPFTAVLRTPGLLPGALFVWTSLVWTPATFGQDFRPLADLAQQVQAEGVPAESPIVPMPQPDELMPQLNEPEEPASELDQLRAAVARQQELIDQLSKRADTWDQQLEGKGDDNSGLVARVSQLETNFTDYQKQEKNFLDTLPTQAYRQVSGRIHLDVWNFPESSPGANVMENGDPAIDPQSQLLYRRLRFGISGQVPPLNMSYRVEIEFSGQEGSRFRDAWIGWNDLVVFNTLRVGNQKRPYGWDQLNSSNFMVFLERPFVDEAFNDDARRFGIASYGATEDQVFNWQYGLYTLPQIQNAGSNVNDRVQPELAWRLGNTWWYDETSNGRGYAYWALAGTFAFPDSSTPLPGNTTNQAFFDSRPEARSTNPWLNTGTIAGANSYQIFAVESVFNVGPVQIAGELMNLWLQRASGYDGDLHLKGGYIYASWFLTGEHIPWNRQLGILGRTKPFEDFFNVDNCQGQRALGWGAWQAAVRLSYADFNSEDIFGGVGRNLTLALNWYWNANSRLQFNYIFGRIDDRLAPLNSGGNALVSGGYQIAGVRFMIDF